MKTAMILIAASLLIATSPSALAATTPAATDPVTSDLTIAGECDGLNGLARCAATQGGKDACYILYGNPSCATRTV
ncbi:MAG: hypothetical protein WDA16_05695 [Candidatus Thermoplasmatota archaeon]